MGGEPGRDSALFTPLGFASLRARGCRPSLAKQPILNVTLDDAENPYDRPGIGIARPAGADFRDWLLCKRGAAAPSAQRAAGERSKIRPPFPSKPSAYESIERLARPPKPHTPGSTPPPNTSTVRRETETPRSRAHSPRRCRGRLPGRGSCRRAPCSAAGP